ncbi:hypothetical protein JIN84_02675 [Luteolibacter yonseiensis]|uniref:Uncharacterized protein n=1 Tax=Luteolibacter yonseiensis TaxID=1144680 RepID=A0A934R199_9BACT|nr:hypothetical protein [Luteolibacter yonseiensis]MBK1814501.1 hypothetical protein [Luteolibacter yonseiensis]
MKPTSITTLAALVLIGAGGFMAGRISSPTPETAGKDSPTETRSTRSQSSLGSSSSDAEKRSSRGTKSDRKGMDTAEARHARLESIVRGENPLERNRALLAYLDQLGPGEFEGAVEYFRSLGLADTRTGEYALLLTAWAQADPLAALGFAKDNTQNGFTQDTILTTWATVDPEAALRWAQSQHTGDGPNPYLPGVIRGIAATDPVRATELLSSMPNTGARGKALDFILPHVLQQGVAATHAWIDSISDDVMKNGAMVRAAEELAKKDPAGTVTWLLANPGEAAQRRIDDVYSTWIKTDSVAALASFDKLPAGEVRTDALRGLIGTTANDDPAVALALMERYPNDVNDRVLQDFVQESFKHDPATAANQIPRIADERERDQAYRRTLGNWLERDATAANAWMAANEVPDAVRQRLAERQERQRGK